MALIAKNWNAIFYPSNYYFSLTNNIYSDVIGTINIEVNRLTLVMYLLISISEIVCNLVT